MATLRPDPTFYTSAKQAAEAPPEELAYLAMLSPNGSRPDAIGVVDVKPGSKSYGRVVGQFDMPNRGDELHHFGWNACSASLCPWAPHPHVERRYLIVPGINSSRIHVLDTKSNPRKPELVKVIEPETLAKKTNYASPHTVHCGPDGIYISALGAPDGEGPGGVFILDHDSFEPRGIWEKDRGPQRLGYDFAWHLGHDTTITSEWGTPNMVRSGVVPELLLGGKYGNSLHVWDLRNGRHQQKIPLGDEYQMTLELRPARDPAQGVRVRGSGDFAEGSVGVRVALVYGGRTGGQAEGQSAGSEREGGEKGRKRDREVEGEEGDRDSRRAGGPGRPASATPGIQGGRATHHRHQPVAGRPAALRVVLGHRRAEAVRRLRSVQSQAHRHDADRRHRAADSASGSAEQAAQRWSPDGGAEPGRTEGLPDQRALLALGRAVLSRRPGELDGEVRYQVRRGDGARLEVPAGDGARSPLPPGPAPGR